MKSIKYLLSGIGCLLAAIICYLLIKLSDWLLMWVPFFITSVAGLIFLVKGTLPDD